MHGTTHFLSVQKRAVSNVWLCSGHEYYLKLVACDI